MKFLKKVGAAVVFGFVAAFAVSASASGGDMSVHAADVKSDAPVKKEESTIKYTYIAQAGDAYTQLVRKAVQTYGIQNKKNIGNARIVAIETKVSEQAGWPLLSEGQVVSFDQKTIKAWVDDAMKLSDVDVAAWQVYVPYIDFDTRAIGE